MLRHLDLSRSDPRRSDTRRSDPRHSPLRSFALDRSGVTAVEYGLMAALIALTIFAAVSSVGQGIKDTLYGQIVTALQNMGK
jgi:pilus assembly protein Flp/PilA